MTAPGGGEEPPAPRPEQQWPQQQWPQQQWPPAPGYGYPPPGYGAPPPGHGYPSPGYGYPPPGSGYPPPGYGYPPPGHGYPPPGHGYPPPGHGYPPPGHGYPPPAYGYPQPWYGYPPPYGRPPAGHGYGYPAPPYGYGYPPPWAKPPRLPPHDVPQPYLRVMRARTWAWWKPLVGLLLLAAAYAVAAVVAVAVLFVLLLPSGRELLSGLAQEDLTDPRVLLLTNLSLIVAIPAVWLVWGVVHRMRIGWSSSVHARLRWRLLLPWTLLALATVGIGIGVSIGADVVLGARLTGPAPTLGWLLLVVILTTPLQSAAEEYVFRGYLSQAIAAWFRSERAGAIVAGLVTAALFSLAHVPPDVPSFLDRFAVGLAASAVVWLTGGLEASIALHTVNNVLVFVLAGALGESTEGGGTTVAGWADLAITVLALAGYVALVAAVRRRVGPDLRTAALDPGQGVPPPWPFGSGMVSSWRREVPHRPWGMG